MFKDLTAAVVCGVPTAAFAMSYAALVFAGPLSAGQPAGIMAMAVTCLVAGLGTALLSSLYFSAASPDGNSAVILAVAAAGIGRMMGPTASPSAMTATVLTMLMLSSITIGAGMALLGVLRVGRFVRFVPYQVLAGFLGATGWFLTVGGAVVGTGVPLHWATLTEPNLQAKLAATFAIGIAMLILVPRIRSPLVFPGIAAGAVALHHAIAAGIGVPLATQTRLGWLLDAPEHLSYAFPWAPATLRLVDWLALERTAPDLLAALVVAVLTVVLNVSALEVATAKDADINRELIAGGVSAAGTGLLGGAPGYVAVSRSLLLLRAGATTRLAACASALIAGLAPILRPSLLGLVPFPVLGGLLVYLGVQLLEQWVMRSRRSLSTAEWLTVLLVLAATIHFGFVVGVFIGFALCCANFAMTYGRAAPTRARYRGDVASSNVSRPESDRALLKADAAALLVLHLQGFLFFGTASRLLDDVRAEIAAGPPRLRFLVLDFQNVDGIDGSAVSSFARIGQIAAEERIVVVLTAMPPGVARRLGNLPAIAGARPHVFASLDQALEWCEDVRLVDLRAGQTAQPSIQERLAASFGDATVTDRFVAHLRPLSVDAGTVLMQQDEMADDLMFVESGRVSIILRVVGAPEIRARTMGVGAMIGEIGFLLGEPRTATVVADTACRLLCLNRAILDRIERDDPEVGFAFHRVMAQLLAHRLIDKDGMIAALMRTAR